MNNNILQKIKSKYGDHRRCSERGTGCNVDLSVLNCIVLKGEELVRHSEKICDCFIFDYRNTLTVYLVELKSKNYNAQDITEKFENSLKKCLDVIKSVDSNDLYTPILILAAHKHRSVEYRILKRPIKFNKRTYHLRFEKCGLKISAFPVK